jgi:hypothetical protein
MEEKNVPQTSNTTAAPTGRPRATARRKATLWKNRTADGKTITGSDAPPHPVRDIITQADLRSVRDTVNASHQMAASIARRIDLGADIERGPLVVVGCDYEGGAEPGNKVTGHNGGFWVNGLNVDTRERVTKRKAEAVAA